MDCVSIGDSIATYAGVGGPLSCEIRAVIGLPSSRIINLAPGKWHEYCIISAGSNDPVVSPKLASNLEHIRAQSQCKIYVWIEPANSSQAAATVVNVAREHNDYTVTFVPGSDGVHPASYSALVNSINKVTGQ